MRIIYTDHARLRLNQNGLTELEIEHALTYPKQVKKSFKDRMIAIGTVKNREVKIVFVKRQNYIKIVTIR